MVLATAPLCLQVAAEGAAELGGPSPPVESGRLRTATSNGAFARLSPGDRKIANVLYAAQRPPSKHLADRTPGGMMTLDEIAVLSRGGEAWPAVFKEMKARGLIDARSLDSLLHRGREKSAAHIVRVEGATLGALERTLFDAERGLIARGPVDARFGDLRLTGSERERLLGNVERLRTLREGSRVRLEGQIDGRPFAVEVRRGRSEVEVRTDGLDPGPGAELRRFSAGADAAPGHHGTQEASSEGRPSGSGPLFPGPGRPGAGSGVARREATAPEEGSQSARRTPPPGVGPRAADAAGGGGFGSGGAAGQQRGTRSALPAAAVVSSVVALPSSSPPPAQSPAARAGSAPAAAPSSGRPPDPVPAARTALASGDPAVAPASRTSRPLPASPSSSPGSTPDGRAPSTPAGSAAKPELPPAPSTAAPGAPSNPVPAALLSGTAPGTLVALAADPAGPGGGMGGFSRNHWISSRNRMLSAFGEGAGPLGDNSLRLYDPVMNRWEYVWPAGRGGVPKRDNHGSFYVPALDEFWIWDGSYLSSEHYRSGRFSFKTGTWVALGRGYGEAFVEVLRGGVLTAGIIDMATAWSAELDMGVIFGGSQEGNAIDLMYIVEPNPEGPERYRVTPFTGARPPARAMAQNLLVAAGTEFYLFGGYAGGGRNVRDFWKFDGVRRVWTRLADPPATGYTPAVTYDSDRRLVVAWVDGGLYAYALDTGRWYDVTPPGLPCVNNQMAVYAPTAKMHVYEGGNLCGDRGPFNRVVGITMPASLPSPAPGSSTPPPTPAPAPPPPPAPRDSTPPSVVITAPASGTTVVGKLIVTAQVSDNVGVAGVQLRVDGANTGPELTSTPYSFTLETAALAAGPHTLTVAARDAAGNVATAAVAVTVVAARSPGPPASPSPGQRIALPLKTWVKVPLPPNRQGPCTAPYGCKHVRAALNSDNGRIYFFGGDYEAPPYPALFSYSIAGNDWMVEVPRCGNPGDTLVPRRSDQVAWAYDARRHVFHYTGGFFFDSPMGCPVTETAWPLIFDPSTRKWTRAPYPGLGANPSSKSQFGYYDPVTDSVLHIGLWKGNNGVLVLDLSTNTWSGWSQGYAEDGTYINEGDLAEDNQAALDVEGRHLYVINRGPGHQHARLLRYNLDSRTVTNLGDTPQQSGLDIPLLAWDSVNRVLFWLTSREGVGSVLWAYKPATRTWEQIPMQTPDGVTARGNILVFDPLQNALLLMGGVNWNNEPDPSFLKDLFLYRYGDGDN